MTDAVRIGILGDLDPASRGYKAINDALQHCAAKLQIKLDSQWIATPSVIAPDAKKLLESLDGIWAAPGSPYKNFDGMLKGIEFARRHDWPFLGTCGGFQYALIECARNVLGIKDADTAENNSGSKNIVIYPVACAVPDRKKDAPKLSGLVPEIRLRPGSYLQSFYMQDTATEEYFCNFEVNPVYRNRFEMAGLRLAAFDDRGELRAVELVRHSFFMFKETAHVGSIIHVAGRSGK